LAELGYQTKSASNADQAVPGAVYYTEGFELEARDLAVVVGIGQELTFQLDRSAPPVNDLRDADLLVVVTSDSPIVVE